VIVLSLVRTRMISLGQNLQPNRNTDLNLNLNLGLSQSRLGNLSQKLVLMLLLKMLVQQTLTLGQVHATSLSN